MSACVAVIKGERAAQPIFKALELIRYQNIIRGMCRVLIKVNLITDKTWDTGATTDPIVVEALIKKLKELPVKVYVAESDATMTNADQAYEKTGLKDVCERNNIEFINLRYEKDRIELPIPNGEALKSIIVPRIVTASAIISAAKLKTHVNTGVTLGMKNMFGLLPEKFKGKYHLKGISKVVVDINTVLRPALTVIDGFVGMEGRGPINGNPVKMNVVIAGIDVVATDATACRIMGINPHEIFHIRRAYEKGLGEIDNIQILGEDINTVARPFKRD
ncbi:MAG: DUF362 domain-containing protein [Candidatus Bathyarchaeia archaeon]